MIKDLPPFLRDLIASPPRAGEGVHAWLFRVARQLHAHLPAGDIVRLLEHQVARCGRHVSHKEIADAVSNSVRAAWQPSHGSSSNNNPVSKWPERDQKRVEAICAGGQGLPDLWELSNPRIEDSESHTEAVIDRMFPDNPLMCCGRSSSDFDTRPRESWRGELSDLQLIVPSPMSKIEGTTKDGRPSRHCLDNTGPRRYLIVEFDQGTTDEHAALLIHLAHKGPLVCVVHSGGKSLHGWFKAFGVPEEKLLCFFRYAISLGADPALWTRSQFCRMPDGARDNGNRQTVYFQNMGILKKDTP